MARRLPPGARLVLATHNAGKLRELEAMLAPHGVSLVSAGELGLPEPEEPAPDFAGNARIKAVAAANATGLPALADDSGFSVAALGGAPGVLSARWAGPGRDFAAAMARVRREMGEGGDERAWFTSALCLAWPDGETATFLGRTPGRVAWPPRGASGFGYDPMFQPEGETRTYGEMSPAEKNRTNHRARALAQLFAAILPLPHNTPPRPAPGDATEESGTIMRSLLLLTLTGAVGLAAAGGTVQAQTQPQAYQAQYYPPGYAAPPPPPPPYRYDEAPPPPPPYYDRRRPIGYRCDAAVATPGGGRSIVCPLRRPRPIDDGCECPPPPPPPGYSYGPPLPGRVIP